jgi:branched-chain amino acid aminotransferase
MPLMKQAETTPTVIAYSNRLPFSEYSKYYTEGKPIITSLHRNVPPQCFEQRCKNRSRLTHFLSKHQVLEKNQEAFALMLDCEGFITETTGANIFFVKDDILYTPTTKNILNGISRQYVIALAKKMEFKVVEKNLTLYDAYNSDEAFLTTSSYCILPVSSIDEKMIGETYPGPAAKKLLDRWSEEAGVDIIEQAKRFAKEK